MTISTKVKKSSVYVRVRTNSKQGVFVSVQIQNTVVPSTPFSRQGTLQYTNNFGQGWM